jgi:hypothetical protein
MRLVYIGCLDYGVIQLDYGLFLYQNRINLLIQKER